MNHSFKSWLSIYREIWEVLRSRYHNPVQQILILALVQMAVIALTVFIPYIMKHIVDTSELNVESLNIKNILSLNNLYLLAIAYALGWLVSNILTQIRNLLTSFMMLNVETSLTYSSIASFFNLRHDEQKKIEVGDLSTDIRRGAIAYGQINNTILFILTPILLQIISIVWILSHNIGLNYAIYFMFFAVVTFIVTIIITFKTKDIYSSFYNAQNKMNQFSIEKIQNHYDIKVNGAFEYEMEQFNQKLNEYKNERIDNYKKIVALMIFQVVFIGFFLLCFMLATVYLFQLNNVTSGDFVLISTYIIELTLPLLVVSHNVIGLRGDFIAIKKLHQYLKLPHEKLTQQEVIDQNTFFYFKDTQIQLGKHIIKNFNLKIEKNKCYVVIGQTGIGKTTFIQYMTGLRQVNAGALFYKNIDITQQFSAGIIDELAVVTQHPVVYSGTLRQNLIYNSPYSYNDEFLLDLLHRFKFSEILTKNKITLDSDLNEIYKSFSGGEKQRLSIIRALLKKPQLLIMDEPTAALDEVTGIELIQYIKTQVQSLFIISHAPYMLRYADQVINFDDLLHIEPVQQINDP
nr:ABC transporter ATP-binding protein [Acinetobacter sp. Marseille-Q1620]